SPPSCSSRAARTSAGSSAAARRPGTSRRNSARPSASPSDAPRGGGPMRVTLLASADFAIPVLEALVASGHEVALGSQPARPAGRGQKSRATPVAARASELGLPAQELADVNSPEGLDWLRTTSPDLVAVVAFGQKLGAAVRAAGPWGCLNIHPSLLPRWRGA